MFVTPANAAAAALAGTATGVYAAAGAGTITVTFPSAAGGEVFNVQLIPALL